MPADGLSFGTLIRIAVKPLPQTPAPQNEFHTLQALQGHPNSIKLLKFESSHDRLQLCMDFHLRSLLDSFKIHPDGLPLPQVRYILAQLLDALDYIHKSGYVHKDIKLENILVDSQDSIYLVDFGHAQGWTSEGLKHPSRFGSIRYAAPEIWLRKPCAGPEVDVWAVGVCLFILVTGFFPFGGTSEQKVWGEIQNKEVWKNEALEDEPVLFDLLQPMLEFEWDQRTCLEGIQAHPWMA